MTDALQRLREANPQTADLLTLPASVTVERVMRRPERRDRGRSRRRRTLALAGGFAAALAAVLVLTLGGSGGPGLAQRAYAATNDPGVAHWRVRIEAYVNGTLSTSQSEEGWAKGNTSHTVLTTGDGAKTSTTERRTDGDQQQVRIDGGAVTDGPAGTTDRERLLPGKDPFAAFRQAYASERLRRLSDTRFQVDAAGAGAPTLVYDLDPSTAEPKRLVETTDDAGGAPALKVVMTFDTYEVLAPTDANLAALALRP